MWKQLIELKLGGVARWSRERLRDCDPYLVWAEATTRPVYKRDRERKMQLDVAVLVELPDAAQYLSFVQRINSGPVFCLLPSGLEQQNTRFVTAFVSQLGLRKLVREVRRAGIVRFSVQESRVNMSGDEAMNAWVESQTLAAHTTASLALMRTTGTYLGIIDDGLPFARVRRMGLPHTETAPLWDQGWGQRNGVHSQIGKPNADPPEDGDAYWLKPWDTSSGTAVAGKIRAASHWRGFFYGRRLRQLPYLGTKPPGPVCGDPYSESLYYAPAPRGAHGAAVLGLLAPWLAAAERGAEWPAEIAGLAMVQLPTRTVEDTAGGSLAMRVLDGLRFILWQEEQTRPDHHNPRPLVVNLSYGVHGGPHDGSSMLERAFAEALTLNPSLHLVLPAGNAHRAGCHAQRRLTAQGSAHATARFMLRVLPDNPRDTFVEFWLPATADVVLHIRPPGCSEPFDIRRGEAWVKADLDKSCKRPKVVHFGAIYADRVAQGTQGTMLLLAIGATRHANAGHDDVDEFAPRGLNQRRRRKVLGPAGVWTLTLENLGSTSVTVDAYVERGDAPPDQSWGSRQAYFPDSCTDELRQNNATPEGTLNGIATLRHAHAHVVGAMLVDGRLSDYSAAGPRRAGVPGSSFPDAVVPADWSLNLPGIKTMGFAPGAVTRINGTSAACAVYAHGLAAHLAGQTPNWPPLPPEPPPEVDCAAERQPSADPGLRGEGRRMNAPFEVFPVDSLRRL